MRAETGNTSPDVGRDFEPHGPEQNGAATNGQPSRRAEGSPAHRIGLTPVSWQADGNLKPHEWIDQGRRLGLVGRGNGWWIGDWVRYGNATYGGRYVRAARVTGYDVQTLMNFAYVASRFEISRRREGLSWSHHTELAALEAEEQEHWLDRAEADHFSVDSLRSELRAARVGRRGDGPGAAAAAAQHASLEPVADGHTVVCPACGYEVALSEVAALAAAPTPVAAKA
jgi:hypothetical protein